MIFIQIDASKKRVNIKRCDELYDARIDMGLREVDHGVVEKGIGIVVYEYGLFEPEKHDHFAINGKLFAGNAVLYGYDEQGETVEIDAATRSQIIGKLTFFFNQAEVEQAILVGNVQRPEITVNGQVIWRWPDPAPAGMKG